MLLILPASAISAITYFLCPFLLSPPSNAILKDLFFDSPGELRLSNGFALTFASLTLIKGLSYSLSHVGHPALPSSTFHMVIGTRPPSPSCALSIRPSHDVAVYSHFDWDAYYASLLAASSEQPTSPSLLSWLPILILLALLGFIGMAMADDDQADQPSVVDNINIALCDELDL
ncbi:hypothetical protein BDQ17DRAFT_1330110, partial [Cyathus striatus]